MKQLLKFMLFAVLCGFTTPSFSAMTCGGTYTSIDSHTYMDILVTETGLLKGIRSDFLRVTIKGTANLDRCIMKKEVISHGILDANATEFLEDVTICAGNTTLTSCTLTNLNILDHDDSQNPIHITLKGATTINGSIVFETGQGKVYKSPDVVINGEILGGTLIDLKE